MKADILRDKFLDFFKSKRHKIIISDSLVPTDDATVLFTPAGMNQFKKEFLGLGRPLERAATSQRCLRTDDLDKVGKTPGHHTFFEMLGNFSFGDYGKVEAITWAWEFLVQVLKMEKKRLWVTVYKDDHEAYDIWSNSIKVPKALIIRLDDKANFWPSEAKTKGPNGPCGPCSEIFFDLGNKVGCKRPDCNPACDCGRFVEVWNLVFTQFNRKEDGVLEPLPKKNIDTGMGLERLAAVMQGANTNFETDLFKPLVKEVSRAAKRSPNVKSVYAVADHIRAITFAIYDGVLPANEKRGYVVRKLIREGVMHLLRLGAKRPYLYRLVPVVAEVMRGPYPELQKRQEDIAGVILAEEENFLSIIKSGPELTNRQLKEDPDKSPAQIAFINYDTYGVPISVTGSALKIEGIHLDPDEVIPLLNSQKERSRSASSMKGNVFSLEQLPIKAKKTHFVGYANSVSDVKIIAILLDNQKVKMIQKGQEARIVLDQTVFYPESGGQVADIGEIRKGKNVFNVSDVKRADGVILHIGKLESGILKQGDSVKALIDSQRRLDIARNHTATHLLQSVLRTVLGEHVKQQGSLVAPDRLRFDFTHFKNVAQDELDRIEQLVNRHIWDNDNALIKTMPFEQAKKIGALAFFEEKYQKRVRVLLIGDYSRELCAGTHLNSTGPIGLFKIISEGSVASGIRRIEAATGRFAYAKIKQQQDIVLNLCQCLKVPQQEIIRKTEKLLKEMKDLQKRPGISTGQLQLNLEDILNTAEDFSGIKLITHLIPDVNEANLRSLVDSIKKRLPNSVCLLATKKNKKAVLVVGVAPDLLNKNFNAGNLIKEISRVMHGSGGGRADFALGAGDVDKIESGFNKLKEIIKDSVKVL